MAFAWRKTADDIKVRFASAMAGVRAGRSAAPEPDQRAREPFPQPDWGHLFASIKGWRPSRQSLRGLLGDLFRTRPDKSAPRLVLAGLVFAALFGTLISRVLHFGLMPEEAPTFRKQVAHEILGHRPAVLDRNGELMAADVRMVSVFAEPRRIIDKDEAVELLNAVFPDLDAKKLRDEFSKRSGFVWIKREITPRQQAEVHRLGLPGVGFIPEQKRVYPNGPVAAHVLGFANVDNVGIAGIEKWIDAQNLTDPKGQPAGELKPVQLSIDMRATHAMRLELVEAMRRFKAKAAGGIIMDVNTGEIVAQVSLPDYDPNQPTDALKPENINHLAVGVYEMGSTFKALTTAMALDSGKVSLTSNFDATRALRYGRFQINDYHGQRRVLQVPEIFTYSSNIGTARMALAIGVEGHKAFLRKMGQLERLRTEMPETAMPIIPQHWGELNTMTISFGHGLAVSPLQAVAATAALVNGGYLINPTYLKRTREQAEAVAKQVIKPTTSEAMRYVMRLNAERGTASKADIAGYYAGGKTGTSEKVVGGRYSKTKVMTTFMAVVPSDKPKYLFLTLLDEPQGTSETHGYATSGWNAAPTTGKIIERVGPMLDVTPRFDLPRNPFPMVARLGVRHQVWQEGR
jgi:cell division protein FtsI (penicillin-binding protein 3)